MPSINLTAFGGMAPRTGTRLLPDNGSASASNVKLQSGELRPLNYQELIYAPEKTLPSLTIYRARNGTTADDWLTWPFDVDVIQSPLSVDVESRFCWTGDGEPRMGRYSDCVSGSGDDYPHSFFALGVPNPTDKPAVSHAGGTGSAATRFYCYTYFSQLGEESGPSPISDSYTGKVDGTWTISNLGSFPINTCGGTASFAAGETTFTDAASAPHWLRVGDEVVISSTKMVVTSVPSAHTFKVAGDYSAAVSWARFADWNTSGMKRRLYRTTGTTGSWQLVDDDVTIDPYSDTLLDSQILGDELISQGWNTPPTGLKGLVVHSSGALAGFVNNQLWLSEPYQPHAWISANTLATNYPIVGIAAFASEIAVATSGNPYVASGTDPASMSMEKIDGLYPCVAKRSVCAVGDGIIYASNHGLIYVGQAGVRVFTEAFYTRDEWLPLNPASMVCEYTNGRVYVAYETAAHETSVLLFDGPIHVVIGISASELYADQATGELYIGDVDGISLFDSPATYPMPGSWRSKDFVLPTPCNLGAAKVDFKLAVDQDALAALVAARDAVIVSNEALLATGNLGGSMGLSYYCEGYIADTDLLSIPEIPPSNQFQFILRSGDTVIFSKVIEDTKAFRLPAGIKYDLASIEVVGQGVVFSVKVAETMDSLKQI